MDIAAIKNYQPFQYTKKNFDLQPQPTLWKKVVEVALAIFMAIPYLLLDLVLFPISFIANVCCKPTPAVAARPPLRARRPNREDDPPPPPPPPPPGPALAAVADGPPQDRLQRLQRPPFRQGVQLNAVARKREFYEHALTEALSYLGAERANIYKQLIENQGVPDDPAIEAPVEIFKWVAECVTLHFARWTQEHPVALFPYHHEHLNRVLACYNALTPEGRARVTLKIIDNQYEPGLTDAETNLLRAIQDFSAVFHRRAELTDVWDQLNL